MIGPAIPDSTKRSTTPEAGPSLGPQLPTDHAFKKPTEGEEDEDEDEDDYVPELPPDLVAQRGAQKARVLGPSLPLGSGHSYDDSEDEDVGPMPLPAHLSSQHQEKSAVEEFLEREKRRQQALEDAAKPKALKREEWMLVPPSKSDLLGSIDPTRLTKGRKFAPTTNPYAASTDTTLWTETPAERQQRVADELSGKKRRKENAEVPDDGGRDALEARKRQKTEYEIQKAVTEHNRKNRPESLLQIHAKHQDAPQPKSKKDEAIWEHSRDMALSGRLMDEKSRNKVIADSAGLSDRFGSSKFS
ncbi:hypothetical protein BJ322DRAFT_1101622 [Thelephora terrestris]|uniref:DUF3752 domain-containing protein n=1 Tax=Thelephora terrestris TaxID=56493 RepID=A0A9P6H5L9_9AGAM|nr:hypothetical protein BJ322DRAFT_1101622 [Thelephora terrestris]